MPSTGISQNLQSHFNGSQPNITKISKLNDKQGQKIVISGNGFGTMQPYNGDSNYLQILDTTGGWSAGYTSSFEVDSVWLNVTSWSDKKIVINGFTGAYGQSYWILMKGDSLQFSVWNAQNHSGPAKQSKKVK